MIHPFVGDLSNLKDSEIEEKVSELNRKYYLAARLGNNQVLTQIANVVTIYKEEMQKRYLANSTLLQQEGDLDQLINVD